MAPTISQALAGLILTDVQITISDLPNSFESTVTLLVIKQNDASTNYSHSVRVSKNVGDQLRSMTKAQILAYFIRTSPDTIL